VVVLLTGIGDDGADGFTRIREKSGATIAQHSNSCVYPNLIQNAIERRIVDIVVEENRLCEQIEAIMMRS
ncbi:MAG: chemotaxis protein CheB, partial [Desulfobacterales bacterium]|jgi:two-component system chemotaxis response regulator CheB